MNVRTKKLLAWLGIVVLICSGVIAWQYGEHVKAEEAALAAEAAKQAAERLEALTKKGRRPLDVFTRPIPPPPEPRQNILDLQSLNPDTVGYIRIDETRVDYPVMQGTDNAYYLNHTFDHIRATQGSIFLDFGVRFDPEVLPKHMLIHGHHMKNGTMFQNVALYKEEDFFNEHRELCFETLYLDTVWEVFSVYVCDSTEYVPLSFKNDEAFLAYAQKTAERSLHPVEIDFSAEDIIMTLNTCSYEFSDAHTLLAARLKKVTEG